MNQTNKPYRRGRHGALQEARDLVSLLGSLTHEGSTLSANVVAERMGISLDEANKLLTILEMAGSDGLVPLSLYSPADGTLALAFDDGIRGKPIRLTKSETIALNAALNYLNVPSDDPLRIKISQAYGNTHIDVDTVKRTIASSQSSNTRKQFECITRAILNKTYLKMEYQGINDEKPVIRIVFPRYVKHDDRTWFLIADDIRKHVRRTFRIDRMTRCESIDVADIHAPDDAPSHADASVGIHGTHPSEDTCNTSDQTRYVALRFNEAWPLEVFTWPDMTIREKHDHFLIATIPYYGEHSPWLPRQLAACGKSVCCTDARITQLTTDYARKQLQR